MPLDGTPAAGRRLTRLLLHARPLAPSYDATLNTTAEVLPSQRIEPLTGVSVIVPSPKPRARAMRLASARPRSRNAVINSFGSWLPGSASADAQLVKPKLSL